jgi:hypothetical protein
MRCLAAACCILFAACPAPRVRQSETQSGSFPSEITAGAELDAFPATAAGYVRGKMVKYEPGMKNYSVGYNLVEPAVQNMVTLYFYEAQSPLAEQFEIEKRYIVANHPGTTLVAESPVTLVKSGVAYQGRTATYNFSEVLFLRNQPVFSQVVLIKLPDRYFKIRTTAPRDQAALAEAKTRELLEAIDWAN